MKERIYLDNNATTRLDPRVLEAMLPELEAFPGNPSSVHSFGQEANRRLQKARETISSFFKVKPHQIVFTSGGTESMNLLLHSFKGHVITSNVEHASVLETLQGKVVSYLPAGLLGAVPPEEVKKAIRPDTQCIALIAVNNETGVKHDLDAIGQIALEAGIPLIVDGVCWLGKELFNLPKGIAGIGFSGHKFHGPKGIGFAIVREIGKPRPFILGGGQENAWRSGTENLPGIVGMAKAIELLKVELPEATRRMAELRDLLEAGLMQKANPVVVNGVGPRICNTCNLSFPGVRGEDLLIALDMAGIAVSHGSACSSGALEPSRVLTNMGMPPQIAASAIRFSLSRETTRAEIEKTIETTASIVNRLR